MNYSEMLFNRDKKLIDLLNNANNKNLELIVERNKLDETIERIKDIIYNKNITGIEARLLIQDILEGK